MIILNELKQDGKFMNAAMAKVEKIANDPNASEFDKSRAAAFLKNSKDHFNNEKMKLNSRNVKVFGKVYSVAAGGKHAGKIVRKVNKGKFKVVNTSVDKATPAHIDYFYKKYPKNNKQDMTTGQKIATGVGLAGLGIAGAYGIHKYNQNKKKKEQEKQEVPKKRTGLLKYMKE